MWHTWMASLLLPGVADKPSTRNLHFSSRSFFTASTTSLFPLALWHSSTTRHTTFLWGQIPGQARTHQLKQQEAPVKMTCSTYNCTRCNRAAVTWMKVQDSIRCRHQVAVICVTGTLHKRRFVLATVLPNNCQ